MLPALNVRRAVGAFPITNWHIHDLQTQFGCAEQKVEIAEWVEITKVNPVSSNPFIVGFPENFCPAKCIFNWLSQ